MLCIVIAVCFLYVVKFDKTMNLHPNQYETLY
jgi:hypothetical protein